MAGECASCSLDARCRESTWYRLLLMRCRPATRVTARAPRRWRPGRRLRPAAAVCVVGGELTAVEAGSPAPSRSASTSRRALRVRMVAPKPWRYAEHARRHPGRRPGVRLAASGAFVIGSFNNRTVNHLFAGAGPGVRYDTGTLQIYAHARFGPPDGQRERIRRPLRRRRRLPAQRRPQLPGGHRLRRQRPRDGRHVFQVPATERPAPGARDRRGGRRRRPAGTHTHTATPTAPGGESPANPRGSACHLEGTAFACLFAFRHFAKILLRITSADTRLQTVKRCSGQCFQCVNILTGRRSRRL